MHQAPTGRVRRPRFEHGLGDRRTDSPTPVPDISRTLNLPISEGPTRHDDLTFLLLATRALVFCGFKRSLSTTIPREAQFGSDTYPRIKSLPGVISPNSPQLLNLLLLLAFCPDEDG